MRLPITLSLSLLLVATLRAEAPSVEGTLPEDNLPALKPLLKEAVERSPNTIMASIAVAQAVAGQYAGAAPLWPQVSANASYQETRESESTGSPSTAKGPAYGLSVSQSVFQWGANKNNKTISDLAEKIAERNYAEAYRLLAVTIREQYIGLIGRKILLRNAQFSLKLSQEALEAQQARFEAGSSSQAELGNFRISVDEAQLAADRAAEDYRYGRRTFTRLVGIDDIDDASIPLQVPHGDYSSNLTEAVLTGFVGEGIESTFQNQVYQMYLKQADLNYSIAKVRLLPKVSASASYAYSNQLSLSRNSISQIAVQSEGGNIGATWTLFDGFATRGAKLQALENRRQYERLRQNYVDQTIDTITDMRQQIALAAKAMSIAEVHQALFDAQVKRLNQDKDLGYTSQATIDSGLLTLYSYDYLMAYARSDYFNRWVEFISLAGIDPALGNISSRYVR
jgi:outer membrane protein TolC